MKCSKYYKDQEKLKAYKKRNRDKYLNRDIDCFNKYKPWSDNEIKILLESNKPYIELAKILGRSISSITGKKVKLMKERKEMELELGNIMFNTNKNQRYECPEFVIALLRDIERELKLTMFAITHEDYDSPFDNTGNSFKELKDIFEVQAYNWNEENLTDYNFIFNCGNDKFIKISWYKYLGRDTTININLHSEQEEINQYLTNLIVDCYNKTINALKQYRKENEYINKLSPVQSKITTEAEWEMGNSSDEDVIYLNLKGKFDMRFSRFHLCLYDAQLLANDIYTLIMNTQFKQPKLDIVRVKKEDSDD